MLLLLTVISILLTSLFYFATDIVIKKTRQLTNTADLSRILQSQINVQVDSQLCVAHLILGYTLVY